MIEVAKSRYPDIELEELYPHFPKMAVPDDPALSGYCWEDCHRGFFGAGGLFLIAEVANESAREVMRDHGQVIGLDSIHLKGLGGVK